jgi:hypothetical protein
MSHGRMKWIRNNVIVSCVKVMSWYSPGGAEEIREKRKPE